ncbi:sulfatase family protein [Streptococcus ictaluri 707-05]|uniref:Sulfatase family protein n=1 Tax=Streptococcus ictaluri 707-05 TaxID=764299 RepID=G5JZH2_9STRE|nr:sulfatase family protein [Streptococcus ictaluri 707-05]
MKQHLNQPFVFKILRSRLGFVLLLTLSYWIKTMWAYQVDFNLDLDNPYQFLLTLINPLPLSLLLLALPLYVKNSKWFYGLSFFIYGLLNLLLISNVIYFREFSDFITVSTMLASSKVAAGLGDAAVNLIRPWDFVYILDLLLFFLLWRKQKKNPTPSPLSLSKKASFAVTCLSALLFLINLFLAEIDRPQLLSRGFSNTYIVRGLGLPAFMSHDANQTYKTKKVRDKANPDDISLVKDYLKDHHAKPNPDLYGIAKGRNVIVLHLESFQQFLIDYKLPVNGVEHEVSPFINSLFHSKDTFAFSNVFHQVKAGKSSDAETLMEPSLFGLNQGSFFVQYGADNTQ